MPRRYASSFAVAALALAVLAGCTPTEVDGTPTTAPTDGTGQTSTPTPAPTDQPVGTPIDATCDQLVSADTLFVYNPNFGPIDDFAPPVGSPAATAVSSGGVACRWQNQTSGDNIDISVAQLDENSLTALKNQAFDESEMVQTYGDEAYFTVADGVGVAQVFQGSFWIVAASPVFFEPGDATEVINSVIAALGQ
ncbi:hypothetical protein BH09ACT4_BH09ACT4_24720 [soil metagenome]